MLRSDGEYTCTECEDITFPTETALFDHVHFQHHKQRNWQCPVASCGKTFYLSIGQFHDSTLMLRLDGEYTCTECDITFPTETALFDHVHFQHHKQRNWQCPVACCGKTFYLSSIGQFHDSTLMLRLDGEHTCTECEDITFPTETALFDHVHFQHHKQRNWQCPVASCVKTFYLRATLTKHSRTHTDTRRYVCGTCGKRFFDKQTLDEHGVTHLRIKPFQCHICLKQLTRRSRLRMHLRAHEEELCPNLVLVCAVCSRAFRDHNDVQEHMTRSPECIEQFTKELKAEECTTVQLSPTSGLVRHTVQIVESPKLSKPIRREATGPKAKELLSTVPEEALPIIRCVEIEKAFRCEYCEDVFYCEKGLNEHRVIHKGVKNPFTCHICKVTFATYSRCTTHKTTHGFYKRSLAATKRDTSDTKPETGPSCTGILGYGDFPVVKHFLCEDCGRSYLHWTYLQVHRRMKHANDNLSYKCNQCDVSFVNSWSLSYHRKKQHTKHENENVATSTSKPKEKEDYKIPCRDCDEVLPNKTALYKHRKKAHSDMSLGINNSNNDNSTGVGPCVFDCDGRVFWCAGCGRRYATRSGLEAHARSGVCAPPPPAPPGQESLIRSSHGQEQYLTCEVCSQNFRSRMELVAHSRTHTNMPTHTCSVCAHPFRTLSMLTEHARVHSGERPYPCDICGVAFRRSTAMRNHRLIHSGVRAWACARCPKRFRIRSDLRTHLRLKHPTRLFVIESTLKSQFPKRFRIRSELRTHLRLKHPTRLFVIEVSGSNPTPEEVMECLTINNIQHEKVIEITKMTFPKNMTSVIPSCPRALAMLPHVPRTQVACSLARPEKPFDLQQHVPMARRGRGISKNPRKPKILQRGGNTQTPMTYSLNVPTSHETTNYQGSQVQQPMPETSRQQNVAVPYSTPMHVSQQDLSDLNVQLLLRDGVLINGNQMVQLQLNDYNC
ncbi:hypothetical protein NE865_12186 [Phthorimaea operculella]|nr:hypothetical protein NE865_12186 [Phthorimaea operculella]